MRCLRCILAFLAACLVTGVIAAAALVLFLADWMVSSDRLQSADAIVVLAGAPERTLYAADLHRQNYAAKVLVSRPARHRSDALFSNLGIALQREEDLSVAVLRARQVPEAAIEVIGRGSQSTVDEMEMLKARFGTNPARLLIVTSPLHTRRARMVASAAFKGTAIVPIIVATPYDPLPPRWWTDQNTARDVVLEMIKTVFYIAGGRYRSLPEL